MNPIDFHPDAAQEANDAVNYYDGVRSGLGDDFRTELNAALTSIQQNPGLYGMESGPIRVCPLHRFPYNVYYEELADRSWVATVGPQSRRPGFWSRRQPN